MLLWSNHLPGNRSEDIAFLEYMHVIYIIEISSLRLGDAYMCQ